MTRSSKYPSPSNDPIIDILMSLIGTLPRFNLLKDLRYWVASMNYFSLLVLRMVKCCCPARYMSVFLSNVIKLSYFSLTRPSLIALLTIS